MKIGILTLPLHTNYGGILQAYALQTVLERMGHEVVIIDEPIRRQVTTWKKIIKRTIKKMIGRKTKLLWEKYFYDSYPIISKNIQPFIDKYLHRSVLETPSLLEDGSFDAIVVGSDQIWRPIYYSHIENAYLEFTKDWKKIKRIAYAPSFGTDEWEYTEKQTRCCASLLKEFDAVSVREESGIVLCQEYLGITPLLVLDPTMLLSKVDYNNLIEATDISSPDGELLNYVLDKSEAITQLISFISKEKDMKAFAVNGKPFLEGSKAENCIQPSIESWLRGFRDARFVVTDSFHACVFSLIFNKPFCVVGNKTRGMARFCSLLKMFGQDFRLIENIEDYQSKKESISKAPDVNLLVAKQKQFSLNFLNASLSR